MAKLKLKIACQGYDWAKPILDGSIQPHGIEIESESLFPAVTFDRVLGKGEFDAAELGLTYYVGTMARPDRPFVAIPVFPVRAFRLSSIFVKADGPIKTPKDLSGKKLGEAFTYAHDAGTWARGILRDYYGVPLFDHAAYFVGGVGHPVAPWDWMPFQPPARAKVTHIGRERTLDAMLEVGEIDALFSAIIPPGVATGKVRRLFDDAEAAERAYFAKSRSFPIMHTFVIRTEVYRKNPWVARALYDAFKLAKARVMEREKPQEYIPLTRMLPLYNEHQREIVNLMGQDYWPYGVAANRPTLDAFLGYHHDLGASQRRWKPEELFLPETLND